MRFNENEKMENLIPNKQKYDKIKILQNVKVLYLYYMISFSFECNCLLTFNIRKLN
jgi:hypothetical protein